ncbi:hypothetical protein BJ944DRAFT_274004 [Cunninghamella echinulata]|nr:hypothetical protein BJ944DRAFT_274004 [Cunninghamella echinulata]
MSLYQLYAYYYATSLLFLSVTFFICKEHQFITNTKQLSWILTGVSSLVCSIASLPRMYRFWKSGYDMYWLALNSNNDIALVCFFQIYLFLDLALGYRYYKKQIRWVTGWFHHSMYLILLCWFLKKRIASFFVTAAILELPTLILSIGSLYPKYRSDHLFAISFFILRLVFHTSMIRLLKHHHHIKSLWLVALAILPLHLYWFYGIMTLQVRKFKGKYLSSSPSVVSITTPSTTIDPISTTTAVAASTATLLLNESRVMDKAMSTI